MLQPNTLVALSMLHPDLAKETLQVVSHLGYSFNQDKVNEKEVQAMRDFKQAARRCLSELRDETLARLRSLADSAFAASLTANDVEKKHEEETENVFAFWEKVAKSSVGSTKFKNVFDMGAAKWLGNGKWGWVMETRRCSDKRQVVIKLCDIRHAYVVVKEWQHGFALGQSHPNIVQYQDAHLYGDDDGAMKQLLEAGYAEGKLKSQTKRTVFPEMFVCIAAELMNRGNVQEWMDQHLLTPTGMLKVLQKVASALAYMHKNGVTHNDLKPENILLHQNGDDVVVKLGDLGLAERSEDRTADVTRYGMTGLCMATGEKYGERRFRKEQIEEFVKDLEACAADCGADGRLGQVLTDLPGLMRRVFKESITMREVSEWPGLQNWSFLDGGGASAGSGLARTLTQPEPTEREEPFSPPARIPKAATFESLGTSRPSYSTPPSALRFKTESLRQSANQRSLREMGGATPASRGGASPARLRRSETPTFRARFKGAS